MLLLTSKVLMNIFSENRREKNCWFGFDHLDFGKGYRNNALVKLWKLKQSTKFLKTKIAMRKDTDITQRELGSRS